MMCIKSQDIQKQQFKMVSLEFELKTFKHLKVILQMMKDDSIELLVNLEFEKFK